MLRRSWLFRIGGRGETAATPEDAARNGECGAQLMPLFDDGVLVLFPPIDRPEDMAKVIATTRAVARACMLLMVPFAV